MKELGQYLKETRTNNGVSIDEAAQDLNIDSFLLESIEDGNTRAFKDMLGVRDIVREINNIDRMQGTLKQLDYPTIDHTPITTNLYRERSVSLERYKEILLDTKIYKGDDK